MRLSKYLACAVLAGAVVQGGGIASAAPVTYDFTWTGSAASGFSMVGWFIGDDANADNILRDNEVSDLWFEGFVNGVSIGATGSPASTADGPSRDFNFNFDLVAENFLDGNSFSGDGQLWNYEGNGVGFFDGSASAGFTINGVEQGNNTSDPQNYTATLRTTVVPLPAGFPLLLGGLLALGFLRRRSA